jgi:hypothetical protein
VTRKALIAASAFIAALTGCAEVRGPMTPAEVQAAQTDVVVYLETDNIAELSLGLCCTPPTRIDLEMIGDNETEAWLRCNQMGGKLVTYTENTWVYVAGRYYCEGVDY